ncbi:ribonuclease HII [Paracoccus sp. S1E-3]|uniref:ribonuclease HII n=1 Tax=Paracoccus sp. S1E-3 TaxID=2756130 RepID=UPI0015EF7CC0|nr:ribonuclease HII [Paracoccus sp. S1E-3]MBA4492239.1 ribonuclease HII [Paracoccus sp. S1E-3]
MPSITNPCPDYAYELDARLAGARRVAGVDEAGRGPLAGPVTAAAVMLDPQRLPAGLNDSKKLGVKQREKLAAEIRACADWAVVHVWIDEIDRLNILRASHAAMCRAIDQLPTRPDLALIDGNLLPRNLPVPGRAVVKGDALSLSIAAASILAKTARDAVMVDLAQQFPGYGWDRNAGYPTPDHKRALLELGVTPYHRRSFAPVHNILCKVPTTTD